MQMLRNDRSIKHSDVQSLLKFSNPIMDYNDIMYPQLLRYTIRTLRKNIINFNKYIKYIF